MKYILFNKIYIKLQQFQVIPENKTQGNELYIYIHYMTQNISKVRSKREEKEKEGRKRKRKK